MVLLSEVVAEDDLEKAGLFVVASRLLARRGFNIRANDIENLSKEGRLAWFFDGLDEVVYGEESFGGAANQCACSTVPADWQQDCCNLKTCCNPRCKPPAVFT